MSRRPERKYARFYYDDFIREFPAVYADDAAFAAWHRLLVIAEKMWPTPAELPRSVRPRALKTLVAAGLVLQCDQQCYRIRGLDAERSRRQGLARTAADARWNTDGNARGTADGTAEVDAENMPRRVRVRDETSTPPPPTGGGRRIDRTSPRAVGASPRQKGTSPRETGESPRKVREAQKRGPSRLSDILQRAAAAGHES